MTPLDIFIDIEALGLRPGSALTEIAAIAFDLETGKTGECFEMAIEPAAPFHADLATLRWHQAGGTFPHPPYTERHSVEHALLGLADWMGDFGEGPASIWSWGSTYDFPLLAAGFELCAMEPPWRYWQSCCARSVWRLAFGAEKHAPRPHRALDDCRAGVADLCRAVRHLKGVAG